MSEGQQWLASRLARVAPEDRRWLLSQLSVQERQRLSEIVSGVIPEPSIGGTQETRPELEDGSSALAPEDLVARANAWHIAQALGDEPEWIVALLLARRSWPWVRDYVDGMEPERIARLRVVARAVDQSATASAYDAAVAGLAVKLERIAPELTGRNAFDDAVARLKGLKAQR